MKNTLNCKFLLKGFSKRIMAITVFLLAQYFIVNAVNLENENVEKQRQDKITVSGSITDVHGEPIMGATIVEKEISSNGTLSNLAGSFTITVSPNATLIISYVGYNTKEVLVGQSKSLKIILDENVELLKELVVVGYGTQDKKTLTGSISSIESRDILTTTHSSLAQNLQGKVSGLQIRQNTGEPGDFNSSINIRGFGSPLYIIDGVPRDGSDAFQRLNPQDIENISVIKDAAAAIYGLRAGNGVIIVTTKKGAKGKTVFNYNTVYGIQQPTDMPQMANRAQFAEMRNDADVNIGLNPFYTREELERQKSLPSTDWYGAVMNKSAQQLQHNISANGGTDAISYFVSFGYLYDKGLLKSGDLNYEKYTFRTNINLNLTPNLKGEINLSGRFDTKNEPSAGYFSVFYGARTSLPNSPIYANDNIEYPAIQGYLNPVPLSYSDVSGYNQTRNKAFQSSATFTYAVPFLKGLQLKGSASYDNNMTMGKSLIKKYNLYSYDPNAATQYIPIPKNSPSKISNSNYDGYTVTLQGYLIYNTLIAERHKIDATLVYEQQQYKDRNSFLMREYSFYTNDQINQASENNQRTGGVEFESASKSYIGKFNYAYKDKYLLEYAFRYDGSYRYNPEKRWGFFPVVSAGWRIAEENFMKELSFISNLKLRLSYGKVGEDAGAPFQYVPGFSTTGGGNYEFVDGIWTAGAAAPSIVNPDLTWFTSTIQNVGFDLGLIQNKLNFEFDLYQRDREGLLARRLISLPNTFGGQLPDENLNSDQVRGFDFSISYNDKIGEFSYGAKFNFNYARTKNKYIERGPFLSSMDKWRNGFNDRWSDIVWGYEYAGQFNGHEEIQYAPLQGGILGNTKELPGDFYYVDQNEDGVIDGNDVVPLFFNGTPKLYYGLSLQASWKGFDINAQLQGAGNYTLRFRELYAEVFAFKLNTPAYFYDRWHKADPYDPNSEWIAGKWPATRFVENSGAMYNESSVWRRDASYIRLKSIELGYTFSNKALKKAGIGDLRVFSTIHNILTICDPFVKPFDPEKIEGLASTGFTYPLTKSFNLGFNINF